jgi:hypothetical protein
MWAGQPRISRLISGRDKIISFPNHPVRRSFMFYLALLYNKVLRRADHLSRGALPTVVCRCVWSRNLMDEEVMARAGPQRQKKDKYNKVNLYNIILIKYVYVK